jgi:hypothetical protein
MNGLKQAISKVNRYDFLLLLFGLFYALYWQQVSPIQYTGDSEGYLGVGRMLLGQSAFGMAPIFRTPGYPLLLVLTGAVIPGTFAPLLFMQALLVAFIPVIIYRILYPYGHRIALSASIIAILSGTTTAHTSQIMTEPLFTFLLFLGLFIVISILRHKRTVIAGQATIYPRLFYGFTLTFAALNTVRPIAWPMFWGLLLILISSLWRKDELKQEWRTIVTSILLFMGLMSCWAIADDILFSMGARFSPLIQARTLGNNRWESYLYDLPFNEAYFGPWSDRVGNISQTSPITFTRLENRPHMDRIRDIVLQDLIKNKEQFLHNHLYPFHLFGQYAHAPKQLADRMFTLPNYSYANYIRSAIEQNTSKKERQRLFYNAAKEAGSAWPKRWLILWLHNPLIPFSGPSHGNGSQHFLLAYSYLHHYQSQPNLESRHSLIDIKNGTATQLLFATLKHAWLDSPELWQGTEIPWVRFLDKPDELIDFILKNPNQNYAWDIAVTLWDLMGYNTMSQLLEQVANETFMSHRSSFIMRIWDNLLMVTAGPGEVSSDDLISQFAKIEIYDYLETAQLTKQEKAQLQSTRNRYEEPYIKWQAPLKWGYFLFYLCKPFFLLTSIITLAVLWSRKRPMLIPLSLILPYWMSVVIYGTFLTALPRYTDPTLLLPFIVTCMLLPEGLLIWKERKNRRSTLTIVENDLFELT